MKEIGLAILIVSSVGIISIHVAWSINRIVFFREKITFLTLLIYPIIGALMYFLG